MSIRAARYWESIAAELEPVTRALAFLLGRFSGRVLRSGEHLVPEAALEALADQNIPFTVKGKATYEQQMATSYRVEVE